MLTQPPADQHTHPVVIVGGGIAGLACALALARRNMACMVLEQTGKFSELGAGIQLGPNALHALEALGVAEEVARRAITPTGMEIQSIGSGRRVQRLLLNEDFAVRYGYPYYTIHRAALHNVLLRACRKEPLIQLFTNTPVSGFLQSAGKVQVAVAAQMDVDTVVARALIACDGVWSTLKPQIQPQGARARYSGHMAYRTLLPKTALKGVVSGERARALMSEVGVWWGAHAHVVHYPVRCPDTGERLLSMVALVEQAQPNAVLQGWNHPISSKSVQAALLKPSKAGSRRLPPWLLGRRQGKMCTELTKLLQTPESWFCWPLHGHAPQAGWSQGLVTLAGDAAHPMLPYLAQGAGMALEDAVTLADCLDTQLQRSGLKEEKAITAALQAYETARYARCARVVLEAQRNAAIFHATGPVAWARNLFLAVQGQRLLRKDWLYQFKVPMAQHRRV